MWMYHKEAMLGASETNSHSQRRNYTPGLIANVVLFTTLFAVFARGRIRLFLNVLNSSW